MVLMRGLNYRQYISPVSLWNLLFWYSQFWWNKVQHNQHWACWGKKNTAQLPILQLFSNLLLVNSLTVPSSGMCLSLLRSSLISLSWPWNHERNWKYLWATFPVVRKQPLVHLSPIRARTSSSFWVGTGAELKYSFIFFDTAPSSENCGTLNCGFYCFTSLCSSVMTEYFFIFSHQLIRYPHFLKQHVFPFF